MKLRRQMVANLILSQHLLKGLMKTIRISSLRAEIFVSFDAIRDQTMAREPNAALLAWPSKTHISLFLFFFLRME
jgi:hypothetical protein